jgi:Holliday junction resolvasome RuvABC ATP-dependent DNA helicase subunit
MRAASQIIDEIHLARQTEHFYELMGQDRLVIFCTTTTGKLPPAFLSRCTNITLRPYATDEIATIVMKTMERWGTSLGGQKAYEVAKRSHANPRIGIMLAKRVFRLLRMDNRAATMDNVLAEFDAMGIDADGLDDRHRAYISLLDSATRPVGLLTISRSIGMDEGTILNEVEPALLRAGRLDITSRGRILR